MFDPSSITLGQVSSSVRDFSIVGTLIVVVWKARGIYETVSDFFERTTKHMDAVEHGMSNLQIGMNTVLNNHLSHIESDLRVLSGRKNDHVSPLAESDLLEKQV